MSFSAYWRSLANRGSMEWEWIHWMFIEGKWSLEQRNAALDEYYERNGW